MGYNFDTKKKIDEISLEDFSYINGDFPVHNWLPSGNHIKKIVDYSKIISGKETPRILDVGCGNGLVSKLLAEEGAEVFAVDSNKELINKTPHKHQNISYFSMPFESFISFNSFKNYFDTIYCGYMDQDSNWVGQIHNLNPKMVVYVNGPSVGLDPMAFKETEEYNFFETEPCTSPYFLLKAFEKKERNPLLTLYGSVLIFHLRKDIIGVYNERLKKKEVTSTPYQWETGLIDLAKNLQ